MLLVFQSFPVVGAKSRPEGVVKTATGHSGFFFAHSTLTQKTETRNQSSRETIFHIRIRIRVPYPYPYSLSVFRIRIRISISYPYFLSVSISVSVFRIRISHPYP